MTVVPGVGIDMGDLGRVLLAVLALYICRVPVRLVPGPAAQRRGAAHICELRAEVEDKLHRLPLSYFDRQPRGELLSRVTNDIDNVAQTLQQTLSQLLTSLLTVVGVRGDDAGHLAAPGAVALVTIPVSMVITGAIMKRSQKLFAAQWKHTGVLNGQVEEAFTGHSLVKVFGRQQEVNEKFAAGERAALRRRASVRSSSPA